MFLMILLFFLYTGYAAAKLFFYGLFLKQKEQRGACALFVLSFAVFLCPFAAGLLSFFIP